MSVTVTVHPPGSHRFARVVLEVDAEVEALEAKDARLLGLQIIEAATEARMRDEGWPPS